jgi:hypothetical protein
MDSDIVSILNTKMDAYIFTAKTSPFTTKFKSTNCNKLHSTVKARSFFYNKRRVYTCINSHLNL